MTDINQWVWKLDLDGLTCFNEDNEVTVKFNDAGFALKGKILDMSNELFWDIAGIADGPMVIRQITMAAEEELLRARERQEIDSNYVLR